MFCVSRHYNSSAENRDYAGGLCTCCLLVVRVKSSSFPLYSRAVVLQNILDSFAK